MACDSCGGRKWHVDQITRQVIDCPVCTPKKELPLRKEKKKTKKLPEENKFSKDIN